MLEERKHMQFKAGSGSQPWLDPAMCQEASSETRAALFNNFQNSAFRLETLTQYRVENEWDEFQSYLIGDSSKNSCNKDWADYIRAQVSQGKNFERVHVIPRELSDYLKFQFDWGYRYSVEAGEKIYLVYRETLPELLMDIELPDFWLFDNTDCLIQRYNEQGGWLRSDVLGSQRGVDTLSEVRDELLRLSFPFYQHPFVHL